MKTMKIPRYIKKDILSHLSSETKKNKIIILYGARQVGKSTLVNEILAKLSLKVLKINADEAKYREVLASQDLRKLTSLVKGYEVIFIDEAQRVENIGINLKILIDNFKDLKIIVTGSSAFELANKVKEPLTGRTITYKLFPIAFLELGKKYSDFELVDTLEERLRFGSYPEIFQYETDSERKDYLSELAEAYLYKDIFDLTDIRHTARLKDLLKLLAFQIGSEVSLTELGQQLSMSKDTVNNYISVLEQAFVLFRLSGFSKNLRKEVTKMDKIYFYDLGIRNILIDNLKPIKDRDDVGKLFENFLITERLKLNSYKKAYASSYFWRIYTGAELDYVEEKEMLLYGYEFKYSKTKASVPKSWIETYKADYKLISKENFLDFIK